MPTLPSDQPTGSPVQPHEHREAAESFGVDPARYDRTRPPYPDALVHRVIAASPGRNLLDVGCGTGIAARQFRAAGCTVLGVDPDARMAAFAQRDGIDVEVTRFEDWDPAGRMFDAVIAGTTWHWVDPVAGARTAARVLPTGGLLAPFWHVFQPPAEVAAAMAAVSRKVLPARPVDDAGRPLRSAMDIYQVMFAKAADGLREAGGFTEPEQWRFDWERYYTREEWLDQLPTGGIFTRLPADLLAELLDGVGAAIDALGGGFTMSYATVVVAAVRTDDD